MRKSENRNVRLTLRDKVILVKEPESDRREEMFPRLLSYCDGINSIEDIAKIDRYNPEVILFVLNKLYLDGWLAKVEE